MKIPFCANLPDFNRYSLGNHGVVKVPNMSDEEVKTANKTGNLPEDYYFITKETNYYTKNGYYRPAEPALANTIYKRPTAYIIKSKKTSAKEDLLTYYDKLPNEYRLENTIFGTYMKNSDVKYALLNRFQAAIYSGTGIILGVLLSKLIKSKK